MYTVIRDNQYDLKKLMRSAKEMEEFNSLHAAQPGYEGNMVVDLSDGHMLIVTLWRTEKHAHAARTALEPHIQRLLVPLMTRPSQLLGAGPVLDKQAYAALVEPTKAVAPFTYRSIAPGLFDGILNAESQLDDGSACLIPKSTRAEQ